MGSQATDGVKDHVLCHKTSLLKALQDAGFPKERAERALIASGHKDVHTAAKWLKNHKDDPSVTEHPYRQYILFLTPKGSLYDELCEFWKISLKQCGRNSVHECFPHITLTRFFNVEDFRVAPMLDILEQVTQKLFRKRHEKMKLFPHKTKGYMALFLEDSASSWLSELARTFTEKLKASLGVTAHMHSGQFHLTLANQFEEGKQKILENLAKNITLDSSADWELQVYSRDQRTAASKQFRAVIHPYEAESRDEISMIPGQHIILDNEQDGYKGWLNGTIHETGKSGLFPANYTERSLEWKCWTSHWSRQLPNHMQLEKVVSRSQPVHEHVQLKSMPSAKGESRRPVSTSVPTSPRHEEQLLRSSGSVSVHKTSSGSAMSRVHSLPRSFKRSKSPHKSSLASPRKPRRIFVIRHGERVDVVFGHSWVSQFYDERGGYHRRNLNMPKRLPTRNGGPDTFVQDSPITEIGACQARLTGESLFAHGIKFSKVFVSPAFRCVQTAEAILDGMKMKEKVKIKVEPGLYEWLAWCRGKLPRWLTLEEFLSFGVNIDTKYEQFMKPDNFQLHESSDQYYHRTFNVMKWLVNHLGPEDENVLVVGHSASLDACTRQLTGASPRVSNDFIKIVQQVPYCGVSVIEEVNASKWKLVQPPIPSLVHNANQKMDWRMLSQESKEPLAV